MFRYIYWWFFAIFVAFSKKSVYCYLHKSNGLSLKCDNFQIQNESVRIADEYEKSNNSTNRHYVVKYSDYNDAPTFRKLQKKRFEHFNLFSGNNFELTAGIFDGEIMINKCCSKNSYFEIERLNCVESQNAFRNLTTSNIDFNKSEKYRNASKYLFIEHVPDCGNRSVLSIQIMSKVLLDVSGIVINGKLHSKYCIDEHPNYENKTIVLACHDSEIFCKNKNCFRKCCPLGESYGPLGRKCQKSNHPFNPEFFDFPSLTRKESATLLEFGIFLGDGCGPAGKYLLEKEDDELSYLGITGSLYVPMYKKCFSTDEFCLEHVEINDYKGVGSFLCFSKSQTHFENSPLQYFLLSLGLITSSMFLLLTFLVYLFSSNSRNLYGKTLMSYIACLFTAYICLAIVELKSTDLPKTLCIYMGYAILFSFLAAFFWLSVTSFDIWNTFRADRSLDRTKSDKNKKIRFIWYSLYAWTFPSLITLACAVINQWRYFSFFAFIRPDIGEENCWFSRQTKGIYVFFIAPISIIITFNVFFYIQTAWKIWKVKSDINKMGKQKRKKFTANKDQFLINGKLFIVMGITWSLEIISFFAPHPIWYITDAANALHGVFIFAVFVLKKKVFRQVCERFRNPLKCMKQLSCTTTADSCARKNVADSHEKDVIPSTRTSPLSTSDSKK